MPNTRRYCLTLDLKDDPALIAEYRKYHEKIWPEITKSIKDSGIEDMGNPSNLLPRHSFINE